MEVKSFYPLNTQRLSVKMCGWNKKKKGSVCKRAASLANHEAEADSLKGGFGDKNKWKYYGRQSTFKWIFFLNPGGRW